MEEYITEIKELSAKKVLVCINDAPSFALYKNEPDKLSLKVGEAFGGERKKYIYKELLYKRALNRALGLIKLRDYTVFEISQKLSKEYYPEDVIFNMTEELECKGILNDKRFAQSYIDFYAESRSLFVIKQNLLKRGVDSSLIEELLSNYSEENPDSEKEIINKLLEAKYGRQVDFKDEAKRYKFKAKVCAFLSRKGFSYEKINEAVKNFFDI